jgi:uncharacterized protein
MPRKPSVQAQLKTLTNAIGIIRKNSNVSEYQGELMTNGLTSLAAQMALTAGNHNAPQLNRTDTLQLNLRWEPLTFQRATLTGMYHEYGIIRTAIDQPIDDALRGGLDISSGELGTDDLKKLEEFIEDHGIYEICKTAMKWADLFGGGAVMIETDQHPATKLDLASLSQDSDLSFCDADRWELQMPNETNRPDQQGIVTGDFFYYYGIKVHRSRALTLVGETASSLTRRALAGWGLSKCEKMVRDLNQYIKALNVIFELLDEAKIDVYRLQNYHTQLIKASGEENLRKSLGFTNQMKSHLNALILDKNDEYDQKQLTFSGLAEMMKEIRIGIASTLRMPVTKLFGISASGFNSGEDDIENYNAMIESDIRSRMHPVIKMVLDLCCIKLFGYSPEISFKFKSLRIMSQNDEADMKGKKQLLILNNFDRRIITGKEAMEQQRAEGLITAEKTAIESGVMPDFQKTEPGAFGEGDDKEKKEENPKKEEK